MPARSHLGFRLILIIALGAASACRASAGNAASDADSISAYSHLMPLTVSGKEVLVRLRLPREIYLNARSSDLRDLRVFDARGAVQAFSLVEPTPQATTGHRTLAVKIFPLLDSVQRHGKDAGPAIKALADGSLVVVPQPPSTGDSVPTLSGLILDLRQPGSGDPSGAAPMVDALHLTLPSSTTNYTARVELEVSNDLKQWDNVGETLLSWLANSKTETLASDRIEFAPVQARYARLRWSEGEPIQFSSISAQSPTQSEARPPLEQLTLQASVGRLGQDLLYASAPAIPVQAIGLQFAEKSMVMPVLMGQYVEIPARQYGRADTIQFVANFRATFYQLTQAGSQRTSGDFALPRVHQAHWVLRPETNTTSKPLLRLSWTPASLVFMAAGQAPYTLAIGRDNARAANVDIGLVAPGFTDTEIAALESAVAGQVQVQRALAGRSNAVDTGGMSARVRTSLLWGVLLLGLAILSTMVWKLVKQMH